MTTAWLLTLHTHQDDPSRGETQGVFHDHDDMVNAVILRGAPFAQADPLRPVFWVPFYAQQRIALVHPGDVTPEVQMEFPAAKIDAFRYRELAAREEWEEQRAAIVRERDAARLKRLKRSETDRVIHAHLCRMQQYFHDSSTTTMFATPPKKHPAPPSTEQAVPCPDAPRRPSRSFSVPIYSSARRVLHFDSLPAPPPPPVVPFQAAPVAMSD